MLPDLMKLAIVTTHPIQYNAPWFKLLAERNKIAIKVFYTWGQLENEAKFDPGFGKKVAWDIPLLDGYDYTFVKNISIEPGSHHFKGIDNPSLINEIEQWNPAAILLFGWSFKSHLKLLRHFKGKRTIFFRGDSNLLDEPIKITAKKLLRKIFLKWVYSHVDIALYVGSANEAYYKKFGLKSTQLQFAPHAIDNDRFKQAGLVNGREKLGIPEAGIIFLFAGKFESKKDPGLLLDAFISLNNYQAYLIMVGNGELENELKAKVAGQIASVSERICFMPFQNQMNMPEVYKMADVVVLPSKGPGETWGLAINEAMACAKAVLVSDKCGCAFDLVENGANGFIFYHDNMQDLVSKMSILLKDSHKLKKMGQKSLQIIDEWTYEKICIAIEDAAAEVKF